MCVLSDATASCSAVETACRQFSFPAVPRLSHHGSFDALSVAVTKRVMEE
jgi:hypothetical protein